MGRIRPIFVLLLDRNLSDEVMKAIQIKANPETIATPRNKDIFNRYLVEATKYPPLTRAEEVELFKQLEQNPDDQRIIDTICKHNLLFAISMAKQYAKYVSLSSLTFEDLVSEANLGLYRAIRRFDYHTGNKFISYAVWWIRRHIIGCIQDNIKNIRIPSNARTLINKYHKKEAMMEQHLERPPTTLEVFDQMLDEGNLNSKSTPLLIGDILMVNKFESSLNYILPDTNMEVIQNIRSDESDPMNILLDQEGKDIFSNMLDSVKEPVKSYIIEYYGIYENKQLNMREISEKYNVPQTRVKMQLTRTLRRLRFSSPTCRKYFLQNRE